jgi:hypothetical protein
LADLKANTSTRGSPRDVLSWKTLHSPHLRAFRLHNNFNPDPGIDSVDRSGIKRNYPESVKLPAKGTVCKWANNPVYKNEPPEPPDCKGYPRCKESNEKTREILGYLRWLHEHVFLELGYVYVLRGGSMLGAVRHGGLIPGDSDVDVELLLPLGESRRQVQTSIASTSPFDVTLIEGSVHDSADGTDEWDAWIKFNWPASITHADIETYPSALFTERVLLGKGTFLNTNGSRIFPTATQSAFSSLCYCPFAPFTALCFESAPAYLFKQFGDFRNKSEVHAPKQMMEVTGVDANFKIAYSW